MAKDQMHQQYTMRWTEIHVGGATWHRYFLVDADQKQELDRVYKKIRPTLKMMPKVSGTRFEYGGALLRPEQNRHLMELCANTDYVEGKARHSFSNVDIKKFTELEDKNYDQIYARLHNLQWLGSKYEHQHSQNLTTLLGSGMNKAQTAAKKGDGRNDKQHHTSSR